jgi:hypothetical protein
MVERLAEELRTTLTRSEQHAQYVQEEESAKRARILEAAESRLLDEAKAKTPEFIDALTEKLRKAAEARESSASIWWIAGNEERGSIAARAMEMAAEHFQEQGLATEVQHSNNAHEGSAHGEEELRDWIEATEWTSVLTATLPSPN